MSDQTNAMFALPDAYDEFMGRYSTQLARVFVNEIPLNHGDAVLDLGCGPGALTRELVSAVGAANVSAIDPSPPFLEACVARYPGVTGEVARAEEIPFDKGAFDAVLSLLVIHFVGDLDKAGKEIMRVTKHGGHVAVCAWVADEMDLISNLRRSIASAAVVAEPPVRVNEFEQDGSLAEYLESIGLEQVEESRLSVSSTYPDFEAMWQTYLLGVGPQGPWMLQLPEDARSAIRSALFDLMGQPGGEVTLTGVARSAHGITPP